MLPKPYSSCEVDFDSSTYRPDSELYNLIGQSQYAYSQQLCFSQCLQKHVIKYFNCTLFYLHSIYNVKQCDTNTSSLLSSQNFFGVNFTNEICLPLCPLECNQTLHKPTISFSQLSGSQFISFVENNQNLAVDFIKKKIDATTMEKSFVYVKIFYNSLSYTLTMEMPQMNIVSLLATIGGNLSLFLGVSVFSLGELIEVVIEMFFKLLKKN